MNDVPQTPKRRRWVKVLLAVSLTLNLLVLGLIVGARWSDHKSHGLDARTPERTAMRDLGFGPLAGALPREDRRYIGQQLRSSSGSSKQNRAELEREFRAILSALRAEPFDDAALAQIMQQQSDRFMERGGALRGLVLERISQMSPEDRQAFADRIERSVNRHSDGKQRK